MTTLTEGDLAFVFPDGCVATRYDTWAFYRNQFQRVADSKAIDFVCVDAKWTWLIEVKDYRRHLRTKSQELQDEVAAKVRDTLAGLAAAAANPAGAVERQVAWRALAKRRWRVILHLRQGRGTTRLKPKVFDPATLRDKLRRVLKAVDPHALVVEGDACVVPWAVRPAQAPSPR